MSENQRVSVTILDKDYQVACPPSEREALHQAAEELDSRMRTIRSSGTIIGLERIAVMTALNLCHEVQQLRGGDKAPDDDTLNRLIRKLDKALE